jgi:tetratricopeptide (TPR) repeat protein
MTSTVSLNQYLAEKQWDLCLKELDHIIDSPQWEAQPKDLRLELLNLRAISLLKCSQPEKAIADCEAAKALGHKNYALHITGANANLILDRFEEVIEEAQLAIDLDWRKADAYLARASAMIGLSKYQEALHDLDLVLKIDPQNVLAYLNLSSVMVALKQHSEAISAAVHATALDPNNAEALAFLAGIKLLVGKPGESIRDCNQAIEIDPKCASAYWRRAWANYLWGKASSALADSNEAISLNPHSPSFYSIRSLIHAKLGHEKEALDDSEKALELNPSDTDALYIRGCMLGKLRRWEEAINATQAVLPQTRDQAPCHGSLAAFYAMTGDVESAMKHISFLLELDPDSAGGYNNRAWIRAHLGDGEAALADAEQAISLAPEILPTLFATRGFIHYTAGRFEDAIVDLNRAIEMDDIDAEAYYFRAATYERLNEPQKSAADREKARQLKYEPPPFSKVSKL